MGGVGSAISAVGSIAGAFGGGGGGGGGGATGGAFGPSVFAPSPEGFKQAAEAQLKGIQEAAQLAREFTVKVLTEIDEGFAMAAEPLAPLRSGAYDALDKLLDLSGLPRPEQGSENAANALSEHNSRIRKFERRIQDLELEQDLSGLKEDIQQAEYVFKDANEAVPYGGAHPQEALQDLANQRQAFVSRHPELSQQLTEGMLYSIGSEESRPHVLLWNSGPGSNPNYDHPELLQFRADYAKFVLENKLEREERFVDDLRANLGDQVFSLRAGLDPRDTEELWDNVVDYHQQIKDTQAQRDQLAADKMQMQYELVDQTKLRGVVGWYTPEMEQANRDSWLQKYPELQSVYDAIGPVGQTAFNDETEALMDNALGQFYSTVLDPQDQQYETQIQDTYTQLEGYIDTSTADAEANPDRIAYTDPDPDAIMDTLRQTPGFQFRFDQGQKALESSAAARGLLNSGRFAEEMTKYGQDFASQEYDKELGRTAGVLQQTMPGITGMSELLLGRGLARGETIGALGETLGNAALSQGQAIGSGILGASQRLMGVTMDAEGNVSNFTSGGSSPSFLSSIGSLGGGAGRSFQGSLPRF